MLKVQCPRLNKIDNTHIKWIRWRTEQTGRKKIYWRWTLIGEQEEFEVVRIKLDGLGEPGKGVL